MTGTVERLAVQIGMETPVSIIRDQHLNSDLITAPKPVAVSLQKKGLSLAHLPYSSAHHFPFSNSEMELYLWIKHKVR